MNTTPSDLTGAHTILNQLGGRRFIVMTGARNLIGSTCDLSFRLPARFALHGIDVVQIRLNESDLYDVTFARLRGRHMATIATHHDVYADQLQPVFRAVTGLDTHL